MKRTFYINLLYKHKGKCIIALSTIIFFLVQNTFFSNYVQADNYTWSINSTDTYEYSDTKIDIIDGKSQLKPATGWFSSEWSVRKKLTIDSEKVSEDLTDYPLLVSLDSDEDLAARAQLDGDDIVFTTSDGAKLNHEIESWDKATGALTAWVKVPSVSASTDTDIYLYYGNAAANDQQSAENVWDANFGAVYHMADELDTPVVKFGYINDVEYGEVADVANEHYSDSDDRLADFVTEMNTNYLPDFVISNSDYIQGHTDEATTLASLQYLESIFDDLTMPRYYALGNHELSHLSKAQFIANTAMEEEYYSFDVNGWHFVVLDYTYNPDGTPYDHDNFEWTEAIIPQEQLDWLESDLASTSLPTVVFVGKDLGASANGVNLSGVTSDHVTINNAADVRAVLEGSNGKVRLAMVPEAGVNAHNKINNIHYIMGYGFNHGAYTGSNIHYAKVELYADGSIDIIGQGNQYSYWIPVSESSANENQALFFGKKDDDKSSTGKISSAIELDGVDDMMIAGSTDSLEIREQITLEAWVNIDAYNQTINTNGVIIAKRPNSTANVIDPYRLYALMFNGTTGRPRFSLSSGTVGSAISLIADSAITTNSWIHLAATYDGTTMRIFQNGTQIKSGTAFSGDIGTSAADVTMGRYNTSASYANDRLDGTIDEVRISNVARSAGWIATSYANQNSPSTFYAVDSQEYAFPTDNPTIQPVAENAQEFTLLTAFSEEATKNGGEIKYQISNDAGDTWYYWNNDSWTTTSSGYSEANEASVVDDHISSFATGEGAFLFRAYLHSDGTQLVQLTSIDLEYGNDSMAPQISSVSSSPTSSGSIITWTTDENASSKVEYGLTNSYGTTTSEGDTDTRVTHHSVTLSNLVSCTTYHYRVISRDFVLNEGVGVDKSFTTQGCTGSAEVQSESFAAITINSGGEITLVSDNTGITINVPANFSDSNATFQAKKLNSEAVLSTTSLPDSYVLAGSHLYDLKAYEDVSTIVSAFDYPLTVQISYNSDSISSIIESTLQIYRWDGASWSALSDCSVDTENKTVTCSTSEFSVFALFGQESSDDDQGSVETTSGNSSSSHSNSSNTSPICSATTPGTKAPWLYGAIAQNGNSILLYFTEADDPVDHYALEFGTKSGEYPWGATNIGGKGTRTYLVQSLQPNTTYYFRVRAGNGCATGSWSNEISAKTKSLVSFNQLEITELKLESTASTISACQNHIVQSGDNLWNIALSYLGNGNKYTDIIDQNKDEYPSLSSSNGISVGWELELNCGTSQTPDEQEQQDDETETLGGYSVNVKVTDKGQQPVEGAKVIMHSEVQETTTDANGIARFENVEPGDHRVLVAYSGFEGEQSINLTGDVKEFNLNITVEQKNVLTSPLVIAIVAGLGLIILVLVILLMRSRTRKA